MNRIICMFLFALCGCSCHVPNGSNILRSNSLISVDGVIKEFVDNAEYALSEAEWSMAPDECVGIIVESLIDDESKYFILYSTRSAIEADGFSIGDRVKIQASKEQLLTAEYHGYVAISAPVVWISSIRMKRME